MGDRNRWGSTLVCVAWVLYGISLLVPAAAIPMDGPTQECSPGWSILMVLAVPFFWASGPELIYLVVNILFWLSAVFAFTSKFGPQARMIYPFAVGVSALAALAAPMFVDKVCVGYWLWSLSFVVVTTGLLLQRTSRLAETASP